MKFPKTPYSIVEKLAIVQALDALILADGKVHNGEINELTELMKILDFDSNFLVQARSTTPNQCALILRKMSDEKKKELVFILKQMALADGFEHETEIDLIEDILQTIGYAQLQ